jgi:hypothetical protein
MRSFLAAVAVATGLFLPVWPSPAADRLVDEKRLVGQSDTHEECAGKITKTAAYTIMLAKDHSRTEDGRITVVAKHRSISLTIEYRKADTREWLRTVGSCDDETYVQRTYISDSPAVFAPAAPSMRQTRLHVMESFSSQEACIADLLSISTLSLGATDIQEEDKDDKGDEMRLTLVGGIVSTEARRQDDAGMWSTTTTTCGAGRETVVDRMTVPEVATTPAPVRTKK